MAIALVSKCPKVQFGQKDLVQTAEVDALTVSESIDTAVLGLKTAPRRNNTLADDPALATFKPWRAVAPPVRAGVFESLGGTFHRSEYTVGGLLGVFQARARY
jgi:hypothetical protein